MSVLYAEKKMKPNQQIIEEFDKIVCPTFIPNNSIATEYSLREMYLEAYQTEIKSFLLSTIHEREQWLRGEVEKMRNHNEMLEMEGSRYTNGFEDSLTAVLELFDNERIEK